MFSTTCSAVAPNRFPHQPDLKIYHPITSGLDAFGQPNTWILKLAILMVFSAFVKDTVSPKSTAYFFIDPSEGISGNFFWGEDRFRPDLAFS